MDAKYEINLAKTTYREAYEQADVEKLLSLFATDGFTDMSEGLPSKYGQDRLNRASSGNTACLWKVEVAWHQPCHGLSPRIRNRISTRSDTSLVAQR